MENLKKNETLNNINAFVSLFFFFKKPTPPTQEKHFFKEIRETPRANNHLSLLRSLTFGRERENVNVKRERELCFFSFRRERERERERISFALRSDF